MAICAVDKCKSFSITNGERFMRTREVALMGKFSEAEDVARYLAERDRQMENTLRDQGYPLYDTGETGPLLPLLTSQFQKMCRCSRWINEPRLLCGSANEPRRSCGSGRGRRPSSGSANLLLHPSSPPIDSPSPLPLRVASSTSEAAPINCCYCFTLYFRPHDHKEKTTLSVFTPYQLEGIWRGPLRKGYVGVFLVSIDPRCSSPLSKLDYRNLTPAVAVFLEKR